MYCGLTCCIEICWLKLSTMKPTYLSKECVSLWWIPPPGEPPFGHSCCSLGQKQTELQQCLNPLKTWCLTVLRHICGIGLTAWQSWAGTDSRERRHMVPLSRGRAASSAVGLEPPHHLAERWECFTVRRCPSRQHCQKTCRLTLKRGNA